MNIVVMGETVGVLKNKVVDLRIRLKEIES